MLHINLHVAVSQELLPVTLREQTVRVTRTCFSTTKQLQYLDGYVANFFLIVGIIGST